MSCNNFVEQFWSLLGTYRRRKDRSLPISTSFLERWLIKQWSQVFWPVQISITGKALFNTPPWKATACFQRRLQCWICKVAPTRKMTPALERLDETTTLRYPSPRAPREPLVHSQKHQVRHLQFHPPLDTSQDFFRWRGVPAPRW